MADDPIEPPAVGAPRPVAPSPSTVLRLDDDERVYAAGEGYRIVQWRNVLFTHWFAPVSIVGLEASEDGSFDLARRHPKLVVFNVIEYGLQFPATDVRRKATSVLAATEDHVDVVATVLPGEGFWASTARAAVATITLLSKARHPHKVFGTTEDAAAWTLSHVRPGHTPLSHLTRALTRLTARASA